MRKRTFYAAKVNIHGNIFSPNLDELIEHLPNALTSVRPKKINTYTWTFTNFGTYRNEGEEVLFGNLTRSKITTQTYRIGAKTEDLPTEHELANTSFFVYHPKFEILVHEANSTIPADTFRHVFELLISQDIHIGSIRVEPIADPYELRREIHGIETITSISFHLIHPNPGKEEFGMYQKIYQGPQAKEARVKMTNPDGLQVDNPDNQEKFTEPIEDGVRMVESGYGDIKLIGYDTVYVEGRRKKKKRKHARKFASADAVRKVNLDDDEHESLMTKLTKFILDVKRKVQRKD